MGYGLFYIQLLLIGLGPVASLKSAETAEEHVLNIYLVSQGWHTGLIVPSSCINAKIWPEQHDFSTYNYLMIGWGDRDYYQSPQFNLWYFTKAAVWPTSSVLHVIGLKNLNNAQSISGNMIKLEIDENEYIALCEFVSTNFSVNENGKAIAAEKGYYLNSRFFLGSSSYSAPNNSNVWTAKALQKAGFEINPYLHQTKGALIAQMTKHGEVLK